MCHSTGCAKHGLLLFLPAGEVCSHAGVRHPPAQRAAGHEGQVLELCLLQVHLRVWSDERAGDARDAVLVCVVCSSRHSTAV